MLPSSIESESEIKQHSVMSFYIYMQNMLNYYFCTSKWTNRTVCIGILAQLWNPNGFYTMMFPHLVTRECKNPHFSTINMDLGYSQWSSLQFSCDGNCVFEMFTFYVRIGSKTLYGFDIVRWKVILLDCFKGSWNLLCVSLWWDLCMWVCVCVCKRECVRFKIIWGHKCHSIHMN